MEKMQHFTIRKLSVGAASILIGLSFLRVKESTLKLMLNKLLTIGQKSLNRLITISTIVMLIFKIEKNRYKNQIDLYICFFNC